MRKQWTLILAAALTAVTVGHTSPGQNWAMNATAIEACTCPAFFPCYFNSKPASHGGHAAHGQGVSEHFCKFNNAYKINRGNYGDVKLDGAKFWVSGDLGDEFSDGEMEWAVVTFDKALSPQQREAIGKILPHVFPVKWKSFNTAEGAIAWQAAGDTAQASIDGGKTAEVRLKAPASRMTKDPVRITNVRYWGTPRNDGFVVMPNEIQAYRGKNGYESRGTNGFMITIDMNSKDVAATPAAAKEEK
jgi:Protein of unknown function (DUF1326)